MKKLIAALLTVLSWTTAKAERLLLLKPTELEQMKSSGQIRIEGTGEDATIDIAPELLQLLKEKGRVRSIKAEVSSNCGNTNCDVPDAPKK